MEEAQHRQPVSEHEKQKDADKGLSGVDFKTHAARAARLSDQELLAECDLDLFVASGPGGQHRNKTESGVRLRHRITGLIVRATERRSQLQNKDAALERLRAKLLDYAKIAKKRAKTAPTKASKRRRVENKRRLSAKKRIRNSFE